MSTPPHRHTAPSPRPARTRRALAGAVTLAAILGAPGVAWAQEIVSEVRARTARIIGDAPATRAFSAAVPERLPELLRCYRDHLAKDPGEVGLLPLSVRIEPTGKVSAVTEVATAGARLAAPIKACARTVIGAWRIPAWKAPQRIFAELELVFQLATPPAAGATVKGGIPARVVAGTIEARLPALRAKCWTGKEPRRSPQLHVLIDFDGTAQSAGVTGQVPKRAVHTCLVARIRAWTFTPPDAGYRTWAYYPIFPPRRPPQAGPRDTGR